MSMHVHTYMYMHVLWYMYMYVLHALVVSHGVVSHFSSVVEEIEIGQLLITRILPLPPSSPPPPIDPSSLSTSSNSSP